MPGDEPGVPGCHEHGLACLFKVFSISFSSDRRYISPGWTALFIQFSYQVLLIRHLIHKKINYLTLLTDSAIAKLCHAKLCDVLVVGQIKLGSSNITSLYLRR